MALTPDPGSGYEPSVDTVDESSDAPAAALAKVAAGQSEEPGSLTAGDELALVSRSREGDAAAFSELVNRYERRIFRLAKRITQNDEDAEDVLQEAFLKAYQNLDNFQGNSKFYTWLVRISVNEALMKLRKRKTDKTVPLDEP